MAATSTADTVVGTLHLFDKAFPFIGFVPASLVRPPAIFEVLAEAYEDQIIQHCPVTIDCQDAAGNKLTCVAKTRYKWRGGVPGTTRVELVLRDDAEDDA